MIYARVCLRMSLIAHLCNLNEQILLSQAVYDKIKDSELAKEKNRLACLGRFEMPDSTDRKGAKIWELRTRGLEGRYFAGVARKADNENDDDNTSRCTHNDITAYT